MAYANDFILGDAKSCCDVCGFDFKQSQLKKRWDGAMCCSADWEPRHEQDSLKVRPERNNVKDARIPPDPHFVEVGENTADQL